jgi:hypothetical protein
MLPCVEMMLIRQGWEGVDMEQTASRMQHALRLLALLRVCTEPVGGGDPAGMAGVIRAEKRLQALDFWLRNPDYLADEILNLVSDGTLAGRWIQTAKDLLDESEPQLHHFPMPKWFYGAYEAVDDAMSLLETYGLAKVRRRGAPPKRLQNMFFLTDDGAVAADTLAGTEGLSWYVTQAQLVSQVAGEDSGSKLKNRQYEQEKYASARWGQEISSIEQQVRKRLLEDFNQPVVSVGQAQGGSSA